MNSDNHHYTSTRIMTKAQFTKSTKTASVSTSNRADMLRYGRSIGAVTHSHDQPITYRALQARCKAAGISAKGNTATLRKRLWAHEFGHLEPNAMPLTRRQRQAQQVPAPIQDTSVDTSFDYAAAYGMDTAMTYEVPDVAPEPLPSPAPRAPKAPKAKAKPRVSSLGVGYRETQRFVALWREQDRFVLPCRNTGWDNLEQNVEAILNDSRFWGWASTPHGAAALAALGVSL